MGCAAAGMCVRSPLAIQRDQSVKDCEIKDSTVTHDIFAQKPCGLTERCWDGRSAGVEQLVEEVEIVTEAAPVEGRVDWLFVARMG